MLSWKGKHPPRMTREADPLFRGNFPSVPKSKEPLTSRNHSDRLCFRRVSSQPEQEPLHSSSLQDSTAERMWGPESFYRRRFSYSTSRWRPEFSGNLCCTSAQCWKDSRPEQFCALQAARHREAETPELTVLRESEPMERWKVVRKESVPPRPKWNPRNSVCPGMPPAEEPALPLLSWCYPFYRGSQRTELRKALSYKDTKTVVQQPCKPVPRKSPS